MIKITNKDYQYFVKRCKHWIDKLHGNHLEWYFERGKEESDCLARYTYSPDGAVVSIIWTTDEMKLFDNETVRSNIEAVAFHEVAEILIFGKLRGLITKQRYNSDELNEITHEGIHRIATLLGVKK